ncbi:MAG: hypothetical protein ACYS8X_03320 [Planctomycetota bacterium]|jgi:hypothetical protein
MMRRRGGYTVVFVLAMIVLVTALTTVMASWSNSMAVEADMARLAACERSLLASVDAWVVGHRRTVRSWPVGHVQQLDVADLEAPSAEASLRVATSDNGDRQVVVDYRLGRKDRRVSRSRTLDIR